jgi:hypothetical protein
LVVALRWRVSVERNRIYFAQEYRKLKVVTEEFKKGNFKITLSTLVASETVIGENTWRPKNYEE